MSRAFHRTFGCILLVVALCAAGCQSDSSHAERGALFGGLLVQAPAPSSVMRWATPARRAGRRRRRRVGGRRDRVGPG